MAAIMYKDQVFGGAATAGSGDAVVVKDETNTNRTLQGVLNDMYDDNISSSDIENCVEEAWPSPEEEEEEET